MKIVTLTLNPCVDETIALEDFSGKEISREYQTGGKGMNVSRVLHNFGVPTLAIAPVGGKEGNLFLKLARSEEIPLLPVVIGGDTRRIITKRRIRDNAQEVTRGNSPEMTAEECEILLSAVKDSLAEDDCLAVCGSACCENAANVGYKAILAAKEKHCKTLLDANTIALEWGIKALPDLLKCNADELSTISGRAIEVGNAEDAAVELLKKGIGSVLVTFGAKGAAYFAPDTVTFCPGVKISAVNPVGSGDCFTAGFLYAQINAMNLYSSMVFANMCGAANAKMFPAARITIEDVQKIQDPARI